MSQDLTNPEMGDEMRLRVTAAMRERFPMLDPFKALDLADAALAALGLNDWNAAIERACRAYDTDWHDGKDHTELGEAIWDDLELVLKAALTATHGGRH